MKNYNLFLDDIRMPADAGNYMYPVEVRPLYRLKEWVIARNYKQFVECIQTNGLPELVSFDHDLADEHYGLISKTDHLTWEEYHLSEDREYTGLDCAKWMVDYCIENNQKLPQYLCHSMNPTGRENILIYLRNFEKTQSK